MFQWIDSLYRGWTYEIIENTKKQAENVYESENDLALYKKEWLW